MPIEKLTILSRYDSILARFFVNALEKADSDALAHSIATAELCHFYARHDPHGALEPDTMWLAGFLHDIGKLGVPRRTLEKSGTLSKSERAQVQQHPAYGDLITRRLFKHPKVAEVVLSHHEWFDGSGYPHGLAGTDIPYMARVVAVASTYDTIRSAGWLLHRRSHPSTLDELTACAGTQFDPEVVRTFVRHESALRFAHERARGFGVDDVLARL